MGPCNHTKCIRYLGYICTHLVLYTLMHSTFASIGMMMSLFCIGSMLLMIVLPTGL